jgi:riboflavin kinase / FMN adenylyltransferase
MDFQKRARLARFPRALPQQWRSSAVAIGNFDGVHLGHEQVMRVVREVAGSSPKVALSFYPHPIRVLRGGDEPRCISSVREKAERLAELGVDVLYLVHFTRAFSRLSAVDFIDRVLVDALGAAAVVVGEDVAVGHNREGDLAFLQRELPRRGVALHVVPRFEINGARAGSRAVRSHVESGDVQAAAALIGAPFTISARVGHGDKRGSAIGFPTANIAVGRRLIPKRGVYACLVEVEGARYKAVANIGVRPTFNAHEERLEVHILDFPAHSLYGKRMHVGFLSRLRDEKKFASVEELCAQIQRDVVAAREILSDAE